MRHGRWYPTLTQMANSQVIITSGLSEAGDLSINPDIETFTPSADINGVGAVRLLGTRDILGLYPHQYLLPSGNMILAGPNVNDTATLNPFTGVWTDIPDLKQPRYGYGGGLLLPDGPAGSNKVILIGGASSNAVTATTETFDAANPAAGWQLLAPLPQPRRNTNTVILPDGTILDVGGNNSLDNYAEPQLEAELYNPANNTWRPMASQAEERAYHSTALLLPDGRVLSSGDDGPTDAGLRNEIFSPPYLFSGPRPVITSAPATITYQQAFSLNTTGSISKAVLMAPGSTTHGNDMHQRHVSLAITVNGSTVNATAPPNPNVAPPGYYMLFLLNSQGVPSISKWVRLTAVAGNASTLQYSPASVSVAEGTARH